MQVEILLGKVPATPPKASLGIVLVTVQSKRRQVKSAN